MSLRRPQPSIQPTGRMYDAASYGHLPLAHGVGDDRHVRAVCPCGQSAPIDTRRWIADKLGGVRLDSFAARVRCCACGARSVPLEIWHGAASAPASRTIWVWR